MSKKFHKYTCDEILYIKNNCTDITSKDLTEKFNKHFSLNLSKQKILATIRRYKMKSRLINTGRFLKNKPPFNKGKKTGVKPKNGFKKGHLPPSYKPVGSEKIDKCGFIVVKIADPNIWKLKHHFIYERFNGIKIKKGEKIIFLDGDRKNFNIDNLILLTNSEQITLAKMNIDMNNCDIDIMKSYILIAKIKSIIRKLSNSKYN